MGLAAEHRRQVRTATFCLAAAWLGYLLLVAVLVGITQLAARGQLSNDGHARPFPWWPVALGILGLLVAAAAGRQLLATVRALVQPGAPVPATLTSQPQGRFGTWRLITVGAAPVEVWVFGFLVGDPRRMAALAASPAESAPDPPLVCIRVDLQRAVVSQREGLIVPLRVRARTAAAIPGQSSSLW
jgi:hypothetical protein